MPKKKIHEGVTKPPLPQFFFVFVTPHWNLFNSNRIIKIGVAVITFKKRNYRMNPFFNIIIIIVTLHIAIWIKIHRKNSKRFLFYLFEIQHLIELYRLIHQNFIIKTPAERLLSHVPWPVIHKKFIFRIEHWIEYTTLIIYMYAYWIWILRMMWPCKPFKWCAVEMKKS